MSFRLGVFDVFATAVPGALMLAVLGYVGWRIELIDPAEVVELSSIVLLILGFVLSFVTGLLVYPLGGQALYGLTRSNPINDAARSEFRQRHPSQANRPFVDGDFYVILRGLQLAHFEASAEISSHRAQGILLRSSAVAFALAAATSTVEIFTSGRPLLALVGVMIFALLSFRSIREAGRRMKWAYLNTLELAAWSTAIDPGFRSS